MYRGPETVSGPPVKLICDKCGYLWKATAKNGLRAGQRDPYCPGNGILVEVSPLMEIVLKRERAWADVAEARGKLMKSMVQQAMDHGLSVIYTEHGIEFRVRQTADT